MLFNLACLFPKKPEGIAHPSNGLPQMMRKTLAQKFGHLGAATDRHPIKSAARMGIELRPYQLGDKLQALSLRTLIRSDRLESRVDESPGRQQILIAVHTYENMKFAGEKSDASKIQVALACAAIVERLHISQSHSTTLRYISTEDFESKVRQTPALSRYQAVYLISDFLNRDPLQGFDANVTHEIVGHAKVTLIVVRDPLEWSNSDLPYQASLVPFDTSHQSTNSEDAVTKRRTIDRLYRLQIAEHFSLLSQQARHIGASVLWAHGTRSVSDFCDDLGQTVAVHHRLAAAL